MFLEAKDTISGQEARAYLTVKERREELFYAKKLEATAEKKKTEVKSLGKRGIGHKANGWNGKGTMTIYYITSLFRELMLEYIKTGKDTYFDIQVTNEDNTSSIGAQTTVLKNCNLDKVIMALFDVESETLEESMDFTYEDVELLDKFGKPITE